MRNSSARTIARPLASSALLFLLSACSATGTTRAAPDFEEAAAAPAPLLSPAESAYVEGTAATLYRGRPVERTRSLVFSDERGHGVCIRSPAGDAYDHTLLVLQRRIFEDFISQAADDVLVRRSRSETAICRSATADRAGWIAAG